MLPNLRWMTLGTNRLTGSLPAFMEGLQILNVEQNKFSGSFFDAVSSFSSLKQVSAFNNGFNEARMGSILGHTGLTKMNLAGTGMTGAFPSKLDTLDGLQAVMLGNNQLTGVMETC